MSHMTHFASGGYIKAPCYISETPRNNNLAKRIKFVRPKRKLSSRCVFCPARGDITKMYLRILHFFLLAAITYACLLASLLLACCLYFCSLAAFIFARLLSWLLLICCRYFCSLSLANVFWGFVKGLVSDPESLYLDFSTLLDSTWHHTCQFWLFFTLPDCVSVQWESMVRTRVVSGK